MPITKERLQSYIGLRLELDNIAERIARMQSSAEMPPMRAGDGSQHTSSSGDRMARAVENLIAYKKKVAPIVAYNQQEMTEIEKAVAALEDPLEREVLRLRYMDSDNIRNRPWAHIAVALYGDDDQKYLDATFRLHKSALNHV